VIKKQYTISEFWGQGGLGERPVYGVESCKIVFLWEFRIHSE